MRRTTDFATVEIDDPSMCTAFLRPGDPGSGRCRLAGVDAAPARERRGAADQRHRRCHQLCPARARSAAARLRSRQGRAAPGSSPVGPSRARVWSPSTARPASSKPGMPVIADRRRVVGLAGHHGRRRLGDRRRHPVDVLLEAANFDALTDRRAARKLGMHTEASHRFERGADPELPPVAIDYAAALIAEFTGGTVCGGRIDVRPRPCEPHRARRRPRPGSPAFMGLETSHRADGRDRRRARARAPQPTVTP